MNTSICQLLLSSASYSVTRPLFTATSPCYKYISIKVNCIARPDDDDLNKSAQKLIKLCHFCLYDILWLTFPIISLNSWNWSTQRCTPYNLGGKRKSKESDHLRMWAFSFIWQLSWSNWEFVECLFGLLMLKSLLTNILKICDPSSSLVIFIVLITYSLSLRKFYWSCATISLIYSSSISYFI